LGNPDLAFENLNPDFPIERTLYVKSFTCTVDASSYLYRSCKNLINNAILYDSFKRVTVKRTWKHRKAATGEGTKFRAEDTCRLVDSCSKKKKNNNK